MKINVTISILGRFHFFDLASQLQKNGFLHQLITSYPKKISKKWKIQSSLVTSFVLIEIVRRVLFRLSAYNKHVDMLIKRIFGLITYLSLSTTTNVWIFFAGNGCNQRNIKKMQQRGVFVIADEGSAHVYENLRLLNSEYKKLGIPPKKTMLKCMIHETIKEYESANIIVVPSTFVKRSMVIHGIPEEKIYINPYGVDLKSFYPMGKNDNVFRVIYCGLLCIQKGSHTLLKAFSDANLTNSELWHIGGVHPEMNPFIDKYRSDKIIFKGKKKQSELPELYSQGSLFVLPSIQDGFGMVALQAMACGLPLLASTNSSGPDIITSDGVEGYLLPPSDPVYLGALLTQLSQNNAKLQQMSIRARERVLAGFSWDDYGTRYKLLLTEALKEYNYVCN